MEGKEKKKKATCEAGLMRHRFLSHGLVRGAVLDRRLHGPCRQGNGVNAFAQPLPGALSYLDRNAEKVDRTAAKIQCVHSFVPARKSHVVCPHAACQRPETMHGSVQSCPRDHVRPAGRTRCRFSDESAPGGGREGGSRG